MEIRRIEQAALRCLAVAELSTEAVPASGISGNISPVLQRLAVPDLAPGDGPSTGSVPATTRPSHSD